MYATLRELDSYLPRLARDLTKKRKRLGYALAPEDLLQAGRLGLWAFARGYAGCDPDWDSPSDFYPEDAALSAAKFEMGRAARESRPLSLSPAGEPDEDYEEPTPLSPREILSEGLEPTHWADFHAAEGVYGTRQGWPRVFRNRFHRVGSPEEVAAYEAEIRSQILALLTERGIRPAPDPAR